MIALWLLLFACHSPNLVQEDILVVSQEQQVSWQRIFNPLLINGSTRWPTNAGIYEPMLIFNPMIGEYVPWLATTYDFNEDATRLSLTIREGVQWSDGTPFYGEDVKFTFELLRDTPGLDGRGLWNDLESIETDGDQVHFLFYEL